VDGAGPDLRVATPPPRPAPRASAFKGLRMVARRDDLDLDDLDLDDTDLDDLDLDDTDLDDTGLTDTGLDDTGALSGRAVSGPRRKPLSPTLSPPHWPTPPVFTPPEPALPNPGVGRSTTNRTAAASGQTASPQLPGAVKQQTLAPAEPAVTIAPPALDDKPEQTAPPVQTAEPAQTAEPDPEPPAELEQTDHAASPAAAPFWLTPVEAPAATAPERPAQTRPRRPAPRITTPPATRLVRQVRAALVLIPAVIGVIALETGFLGAVTLQSNPVLGGLLLALSTAALIVIVSARLAIRGATPAALSGADLDQAEHPRLWAVIGTAAEQLGVQPPTRIVVDGDPWATLVRRPAGSELVIGLPLLAGLTEPELTALMIRELAHDTGAGGRVQRLAVQIDGAVRQGTSTRPRWWPTRLAVHWYNRCFQRLASGALARHELESDAIAAELTSTETLASAVSRRALIADRWQLLISRFAPLAEIARRPGSLSAGLRSLLADGTPPASSGHQLASALLAGGDSDLPRLERALRASDAPAAPDAPEVLEASDPPAATDIPAADWQTIAELAGRQQAQERTGLLAWALTELNADPQPVTLTAVLKVVARGDGPRLVEPLLPTGLTAKERPVAAQALLEELLSAFVITALLSKGLARHEVRWPDGVQVQRLSGKHWLDWDGDDPIRSGTADPAGVAALTRWLRDIGAALDAEAQPPPGPPARLLSALTDLDLLLPFERRTVDLLVYRSGILLAPVQAPSAAARVIRRAAGGVRRQPAGQVPGQRLAALVEQAGQTPQALPGGWWMPLDTVHSGQLRTRRAEQEIRLRLADGATCTLRSTLSSIPQGDAVTDLARLLPALSQPS
jgi:hypothetical protein